MTYDQGYGYAQASDGHNATQRPPIEIALKQAACANRSLADRPASALERIEANLRELLLRLHSSGQQAHSHANRGLGQVPSGGIGDTTSMLTGALAPAAEPDGRANAIEQLLEQAHKAVSYLGHGLDRLEQLV